MNNSVVIASSYFLQDSISSVMDGFGIVLALLIVLYDAFIIKDAELEPNLYFVLYQNDINKFQSIPYADAAKLSSLPAFNRSRPTVIYSAGTYDKLDDPFVITIVRSYIDQNKYNVIQMNYTLYTTSTLTATAHILGVGRCYGAALNRAIKGGLNVNTLTLVGHSLGNEANGGALRHVHGVPYLIGLDPGGVWYNSLKLFNKGYANLTITVHSDALEYGSYKMLGDVNYLPNDGHRYQPGCPQNENLFSDADICDHLFSGYVWASRQYNPDIFPAVQCKYTELLSRVSCNTTWHVNMGIENRIPGTYYFETSGKWPYGLGLKGIANANNGTIEEDGDVRIVF